MSQKFKEGRDANRRKATIDTILQDYDCTSLEAAIEEAANNRELAQKLRAAGVRF